MPAQAEPEAWDRPCPRCGAPLQAAVRRCWACHYDFPAEGVDEADMLPSSEESLVGTASALLLTFGLTAIVGFLTFVVVSLSMAGCIF
jgi:hypothetical protein